MDGVHDLGGMHGFGRVEREADEPVFHADWERRAFGLMLCATPALGVNGDAGRHAVERMDPAHYLGSTYYEHWLDAVERVVVEKGIASRSELLARRGAALPPRVESPAFASAIRAVIASGTPFARTGPAPRFRAGDRVLVRNLHPAGHTRCPRYVRGVRGVIERCHGTFVFPDTHAHGDGEQPHPLYSVRFAAADVWGPGADANAVVHVDLWEPYLERDARRARKPR